MNGERVDQQPTGANNDISYVSDKRFYIGRANTEMRWERYANAVFDDVEVWNMKREDLIAEGIIKLGKKVFIIFPWLLFYIWIKSLHVRSCGGKQKDSFFREYIFTFG